MDSERLDHLSRTIRRVARSGMSLIHISMHVYGMCCASTKFRVVLGSQCVCCRCLNAGDSK